MNFDFGQATAGLHALIVRWWIRPPRHFELQRGLDTVLVHVRDALQAARTRASAPPQSVSKESR